jgi:hypothetical protein
MSPEDIKRECDGCREKHAERFTAMEHRLTAVEVTLWGQRGDNGIRSSLADLRRKMDMLLRFFWIATATPAIVVSIVALLKFIGKL